MFAKKIEDKRLKKALTRKNIQSDKYISDDTTRYGRYTDINNFNQIMNEVTRFKEPSPILINAPGQKGDELRKKYRDDLKNIPNFYSYIKEKIDDYNLSKDKCKDRCIGLLCKEGKDPKMCDQIKSMSRNAQTEEELKTVQATGLFSNSCTQFAKFYDKDNPLTSANEEVVINCLLINTKRLNITNLIYIWLLDNYKKYEEGDKSKQLITEYNQIYDLTKTFPLLFNDLNIRNLFKNFTRIETDLESNIDLMSPIDQSQIEPPKFDFKKLTSLKTDIPGKRPISESTASLSSKSSAQSSDSSRPSSISNLSDEFSEPDSSISKNLPMDPKQQAILNKIKKQYPTDQYLPEVIEQLEQRLNIPSSNKSNEDIVSDTEAMTSNDSSGSSISINSDLHCKKIDNSDPFTLKCRWKNKSETGIGGNYRTKRNKPTKRKRYTKRRANKGKQKKRVSQRRNPRKR